MGAGKRSECDLLRLLVKPRLLRLDRSQVFEPLFEVGVLEVVVHLCQHILEVGIMEISKLSVPRYLLDWPLLYFLLPHYRSLGD